MMVTQADKRHASLFGPIVLIGLGVLLLLSNFGILNFNLWELLFRFWPFFLVAAGLDLLLGRKEPEDDLNSPDVREVLTMLRTPAV